MIHPNGILLVIIFVVSLCFSENSISSVGKNIDDEAIPAALLKVAEKAYDLNNKGLKALKDGHYTRALTFFNQALEIIPNYTDAINNIGVVCFRRGNIVIAREKWQKVLAIDPEYHLAEYNLGTIAFNEKNYDLAKTYYSQALEKNKKLFPALIMLGKIEQLHDQPKKALSYFKKASRLKPQHQDAWGNLAYTYIVYGDTSKAIKLLKKNRSYPFAQKLLGHIYASQKHIEIAVDHLNKAYLIGGDKNVLIDIARIFYDNKQYTDALKTLHEYFDQVSNPSARAWLLAGIAAKECGDITLTKEYLQKGLAYYPHDPLIRFNLGQVYYYLKDFSNAERIWSSLADTLNDPSLYHLKAVTAFKQNKITHAEIYIKKALKLDKKAEYYDLLGLIHYEKGNTTEAIRKFKQALNDNPSLRSAQLNLIIAEKNEKLLSETIKEIKKQFISGKNNDSELALQLSILYYYKRLYFDAIEVLEKLPYQHKTNRIYRHLALYYKTLSEWKKAIHTLEQAREKGYLDIRTNYELAEAYLQAGAYAKAIVALQRCLHKWPQNPWRLYYQLGYAYVKQNNFTLAKGNLEKSIELKKNNVAAHGLLAYVYNSMGHAQRAHKLWENTIKTDPNNVSLWINLGLLLEKQEQFAQAITHYQKALSLTPQNRTILINIGNVYESMGQYEKALLTYKKALNSKKRNVALYNVFLVAKKLNKKKLANKTMRILRQEFTHTIYTKRAYGELLMWRGDTASALTQFESLKAKNAYDWYALAQIYLNNKQEKHFQRALNNMPESKPWKERKQRLEAEYLYQQKQYEDAFTLWQGLNDTSYEIQYNMALAAFHGGKYEDVLYIGKNLLSKGSDSDNLDNLQLLCNSAVKLKDWERAEYYFNKLAQKKSDEAVIWYNLAVSAYNLDHMEKSWKYYQRARKIDPSIFNHNIENRYQATFYYSYNDDNHLLDLDRMYNQAVKLHKNGSDSAAESMYLEILKKNQTHFRAWNNLGAIYGARAQLKQAIKCYKKAVAKKSDIIDGFANLVNIYIAMNNLKQAEKWLRKGKQRNPQSSVLKLMEKNLRKAKSKKYFNY